MNWKAVPIPERMQALPKDARGYPIPHNIWRDTQGVAHFTINDHVKAEACLRENRCPICGDALEKTSWLCGGPLSALHPAGAYIDQPTHSECVHYAIRVCPYLAAPKYTKRLDTSGVDPNHANGMLFVDPTVIPDRPPVFVLIEPRAFTITLKNRHYLPQRPYLHTEFWLKGREITLRQATLVDPRIEVLIQ